MSDPEPEQPSSARPRRKTSLSPAQITGTQNHELNKIGLKPVHLGDICYTAIGNWCIGQAHGCKTQFMGAEAGVGSYSLDLSPGICGDSYCTPTHSLLSLSAILPPQPQMAIPAPVQRDP